VLFHDDQVASSTRRLFLGSVLLGFVGAVTVWAIMPVVVISADRTPRAPGRCLRRRGHAGFCVPVLPFALSAPTTFYRGVIVAQLARSDIARIPQRYRLWQSRPQRADWTAEQEPDHGPGVRASDSR
jgi:hypothetical protein